ncbi:Heparinase II/III family protein [Parafrankia sp. EUN1f]|nr:Heparinase II/III family protein [Parafrankia sp. EUN1f]
MTASFSSDVANDRPAWAGGTVTPARLDTLDGLDGLGKEADQGEVDGVSSTSPTTGSVMARRSHLAGRYLRTVALLRPEQAVARVRLRAQRAMPVYFPTTSRRIVDALARPGLRSGVHARWPASFVPFDARLGEVWPRATDLADGHFTLLGTTRHLGEPADWAQHDAPLLWRYHLHYWDWAWSFALHPEREWARAEFDRLYRSWHRATMFGRGPAWSPYVVSLRIWSWCGLLGSLADDTLASALTTDLAEHGAFLRLHLETDVGGNHLLKNIKALLGIAVAFDDAAARKRWTAHLLREIERQVLPDGGHVERAPAYHCQVLADLDDLAGLLDSAGERVPDELTAARLHMRSWLDDILAPDGTVPMTNDGYPVPRAAVGVLLPHRSRTHSVRNPDRPAGTGLTLFSDSGLAVLRAGPWRVLADVGLPCPDDLPAHAHADSLSFLLWYDGTPVLVDKGTSTYAPGATRTAERATAAHNTVVVDDADSTEVWGAFRAGRRARVTLGPVRHDEAADRLSLTAMHNGYRWMTGRPDHLRTWTMDANSLLIVDRIAGGHRHRVDVLFHLDAGWHAKYDEAGVIIERNTAPGPFRLTTCFDAHRDESVRRGRWRIWTDTLAVGWQRQIPAVVVAYTVTADLPLELHTRLTAVGSTDV